MFGPPRIHFPNNADREIIAWATVREDFTVGGHSFRAGHMYPVISHFGGDHRRLVLGTYPTTFFKASRFFVTYTHLSMRDHKAKPRTPIKPIGPKDNPPTDGQKDVVKNPSHYKLFDGLESIEAIAMLMTKEQFYGFCLGNVLKYRFRAGAKDAVKQELDKANFYKELYAKHKHLCRDAERKTHNPEEEF